MTSAASTASTSPPSATASPPASAAPGKTFQPWLNAWTDPIASLRALSFCLDLVDISGDGEYRLVVADAEKKLKVFKNTALAAESSLVDAPIALASFYPDLNKPQLPSIAVASGSHVFIYRNMRPYYKFALPPVELDAVEVNVWAALKDKGDCANAMLTLSDAKENGVPLSTRSLQALEMSDPAQQQAFLMAQRELPFAQLTVATCMCTLIKNASSERAIGHLVIGTEAGDVLILESSGTALHKRFKLASTPSLVVPEGALDIEYRLFVACRNSQIFCIKKHKLLGQVIECESAIVSMAVLDKSLFVACMDHTITAYSFKFKRLYTLDMKASICALDVLSLRKIKNLRLLLVALNDGRIMVYNQKNCLTELALNERITGIKYGQYGREEASLVVVTQAGKLMIKILQRSAQFDDSEANGQTQAYIHEQDIPLSIPKKTALYVEQTQRERDHSVDLHRIFQRDLCRLRLATAQSYVKVIQEGMGQLSTVGGVNLKLDATVMGLGPYFKIRISLRNIGIKALADVPVVLVFDVLKFSLECASYRVPMLVPGLEYINFVDVKNIDAQGARDTIKVFVYNPKSAIPAISAIINMPVSELDEE